MQNNNDFKPDFSIWWWYYYQHLISIFLDFFIRWDIALLEKDKLNKEYIKAFNNMKKFISSHWLLPKRNTLDLLLEWDLKCFEDINFIQKSWKDTICYFFQSKWATERNDTAFRAKFRKILINFSKNINQTNCIHKLVVIHNRDAPEFKALNRKSKTSTESYRLVNQIIWTITTENDKNTIDEHIFLLTKRYEDTTIWEYIVKQYLFYDSLIESVDWISISGAYLEKIKTYSDLLDKVYVIDSLAYSNIKKVLEEYLTYSKLNLSDFIIKYWEKSFDATSILNGSIDYDQYLFYDNIYFSSTDWWRKAIELEFIDKGKFMNFNKEVLLEKE